MSQSKVCLNLKRHSATLIFALCVGTASCARVNNSSFMCAEWINIGSATGSLGRNLPTCSALMGVTAKRWTRRRRTFARRERADRVEVAVNLVLLLTATLLIHLAHSRTNKWALILLSIVPNGFNKTFATGEHFMHNVIILNVYKSGRRESQWIWKLRKFYWWMAYIWKTCS